MSSDCRQRPASTRADLSIALSYLGACAGLANTHSYGQLLGFRILQAVGSASVIAIGSGSIGDVAPPAQRGSAMALFGLGAMVSLLLLTCACARPFLMPCFLIAGWNCARPDCGRWSRRSIRVEVSCRQFETLGRNLTLSPSRAQIPFLVPFRFGGCHSPRDRPLSARGKCRRNSDRFESPRCSDTTSRIGHRLCVRLSETAQSQLEESIFLSSRSGRNTDSVAQNQGIPSR